MLRSCLPSAVIAAINLPFFFQTMTDDAHSALRARRRKLMDCAFETIKDVGLAADPDFE
jgi:hypothetical protein